MHYQGGTFLYSNSALVYLGLNILSPYKGDSDFCKISQAYQAQLKGDFMLQGGYLFKGTRLYMPKC